MKMEATVRFDREIDPSKHYISPGGYEMTFSNGKTVQFDFMDYECAICVDNPTNILFETSTLDTGCFPDAKFLETFTGSVTDILEFYVYTGEDNEPEIYPVELLSLRLFNNNDEEIKVDDSLLGNIWDE